MFHACSSDSFNPMNVESRLPVTLMASVTPPAVNDRGSKVRILTDPISSKGQFSLPSQVVKVELHPVFQQYHQGIPHILQEVFHQPDSHLPRSDMDCVWNPVEVQTFALCAVLLRTIQG